MKSKIVIKRFIINRNLESILPLERIEPNLNPQQFSYTNGNEQNAIILIDLENLNEQNITVPMSICNHKDNHYEVKIENNNCKNFKQTLEPGVNKLSLGFRIGFPIKPINGNTPFKIKFESELRSRVFNCVLIP